MPKLFGTFGVRGLANQELTPKLAFDLSLALATHLGGEGKVAVGYDNRTSSEMFEQAIVAGLTAGGCDVLRLGLTPTPVLSFGIRHFSCDAGIIITASHNPPEYNGIKFWGREGAGFVRERESEIERIVERGGKQASWQRIGRASEADALGPYISALLERAPKFKRKLKVVVDCANAAGSVVTPRLLRELGCEVVSMNSQLDGTFPGRKLEPVPENLTELAKTVVSCNADLGVAHDGDADRTLVVNERGEILSGDRVFAIAALHHLCGRQRPRILTTVATSSVIDDVAKRLNGKVIRTKVGEPEIVGEYRKRGGDIGGEENGGVLFFDWLPCREGIMTAVKFIEALDSSGMKVSELDTSLPTYCQVKQRVECPNELKPKALKILAKRFAKYKLDRTDGIRVLFDDGWLLLRPSGTEPILRCFAEGKTDKRAKELAALGMKELKAAIGRRGR
ncbi:MAG: phosphoglucosamine mutase [Hadesarchaea archaeon]|nr:phosphoglucosamine mutase [Hadesarchaea archaeon]